MGKVKTFSVSQHKDHLIFFIDDSRAGGCITEVHYDVFRQNFAVSGFVEHGACTGASASISDSGVTRLTKRGIFIFWGDSSDVRKNNSQNWISPLVNFVKKNSHTNIISLCAPHRHDLVKWSCVNNEVRNFNRTIVKLKTIFQHVNSSKKRTQV